MFNFMLASTMLMLLVSMSPSLAADNQLDSLPGSASILLASNGVAKLSINEDLTKTSSVLIAAKKPKHLTDKSDDTDDKNGGKSDKKSDDKSDNEKAEKSAHPDKSDKPEKPDKNDKAEGADKSDKPKKPDKSDKSKKSDKSDSDKKSQNSEANDKKEHADASANKKSDLSKDDDNVKEELAQHAKHSFSGNASWYGIPFHGRKTASGEIFNMYKNSAAHLTLPLPTKALVEDPRTGNAVIVKVNDRGPYCKSRVMDLSREAARQLGTLPRGVAYVDITVIDSKKKSKAQ